ncbi:MAG: hypothetical protein IKT60_03355 [Clostridia bacterium]|nr:hypothetical protein [Clostridia bacterium]
MSENMAVIVALTRLAAQEQKSYGQYVAQADPAELKRRVRAIRTACRRKDGGRFYRMRREAEI